jgi:aryl-alcohol dehydrogenase-like predicted oxidoreductase
MVNGGIPEYYQYLLQNLIDSNVSVTKMNTPVLGTAQLGNTYGIIKQEGLPTKNSSIKILETAWNMNIRFFDTAPSYNSEIIIGDFVRTHGIEKEISILTKIPSIPILSDWKHFIHDSINSSIQNLKCDSIDVIFFHDAKDSVILSQHADEFLEILEQYPINKLGISVYEEFEIDIFNNFSSFDIAFQFPFNILDRRFDNNSIKKDYRYARSIFLQGVISSNERLNNKAPKGLRKLHNLLHNYFHEHNINPIEYALSFVANSRCVDYYLFGVTSKEQLAEIMSIDLNYCHADIELENLIKLVDKNLLDPRTWN